MTESEGMAWVNTCPVGELRRFRDYEVDRRRIDIKQEGAGAKMYVGAQTPTTRDDPNEVLRRAGWFHPDGGAWHHATHGVSVAIDDGAAFFYAFERDRSVHGIGPAQLRAFAALAEETRP